MNVMMWSTAMALVWAMQAWALLLKVLQCLSDGPLPPPWVLRQGGWWVRPERETMLYGAFILFFTVALLVLRRVVPRVMVSRENALALRAYVVVETLLAALLAAAYYQSIVYDYRPALAEGAFTILLGLCVLIKVLAGKGWAWGKAAWHMVNDPGHALLLRRAADGIMVLFLAALVYLPDYEAALARVFIGEQCCHIDHFIMGPGFAFVNGLKPYVDVLSEYGAGIPVVISWVSRMFGAFSYDSVYQTIIWGTLIYIILYYIFLRLYLRRVLLSAAAILLGIKFILFYTMSYPLVFTYPSSTPLRYFTDVFFFLLLLGHMRQGSPWFLAAAGGMAGFGIFYMTSTGLCQAVALYAYLFLLAASPAQRRLVFKGWQGAAWGAAAVGAPALVWVALSHMVLGRDFWSPVYWENFKDITAFATSNVVSGVYWNGLFNGQILDVAMGCVIPLLYVFTLLAVGGRYFLGHARREELMVVVMAVYGLGVFHHHVIMSMANNYYTMGLCYVFVLAYWIGHIMDGITPQRQRALGISVLMLAAYALLTNHHYISYPNVFNFSRNPMVDQTVAEPLPDRTPYFHHKFRRYTEEDKVALNNEGEKDEKLYSEADFPSDQALKDYYHAEYDFSRDAALIQKYTQPGERVALISGFEVKMLMQAQRKPLFYYFILIDTRPMHMRHFGIANLFTERHLRKTIDQIARAPSPYLFMERKYLQRDVPRKYYTELFGLMDILDYINTHYEQVDQGQYLVAMKRKRIP